MGMIIRIKRDARCVGQMTLAAAGRRNENLEPSRYNEAQGDDEQRNVTNAKSEDVKRLVPYLVESRIRETKDDRQDRRRDVSKKHAPEDRNIPILALGNDLVEITAKLVSLKTILASLVPTEILGIIDLQNRMRATRSDW